MISENGETVGPPPRAADAAGGGTRGGDIYLFRNRGEWERQARTMLGEHAAPMLAMPRGGFTLGGTMVLYDVGLAGTETLLAHEGWHQFVQTEFSSALPAWLDEGVATMMEGHLWRADNAGAVAATFTPWANPERFDELRRLLDGRGLWSLDRLLAEPGGPSSGDGLAYYAQVWGLVMFLEEGDQHRWRRNLHDLLADAKKGTLGERVALALGAERAAAMAGSSGGWGAAVFETSFGKVEDVEPAWRAFVSEITGPGMRERIVRGQGIDAGP
jgi:hypothetical protein